MKLILERIPDHSTQRTCADCLRDYANVGIVRSQPASHWRFSLDQLGAKDKSARTPVCERHANATRSKLEKVLF